MIARAAGSFARRFLTGAFFAAARLVAALIAGRIAFLLSTRTGRRLLFVRAFLRSWLLMLFDRLLLLLPVRRTLVLLLLASAGRTFAACLLSLWRFLLLAAVARLLIFLLRRIVTVRFRTVAFASDLFPG